MQSQLALLVELLIIPNFEGYTNGFCCVDICRFLCQGFSICHLRQRISLVLDGLERDINGCCKVCMQIVSHDVIVKFA